MLDFFYSPPTNINSDTILIDGEEFRHLVHVMRKKLGDFIMIVDGNGNAYQVIIDELSKKQAQAKILKRYENYNEPTIKLTLAVGLLKNPSKLDFLVEKTVELGVHEIIPIFTERTIPKHAKVDRWQKLSISAMKQCCRSFLPKISEPIQFKNLIEQSHKYSNKFIFHNEIINQYKPQNFKTLETNNLNNVLFLIGPEGGFTDNEVTMTIDAGFKIISLGSRRLRTETAAIVAGTILI